jgi:hypothetical protein
VLGPQRTTELCRRLASGGRQGGSARRGRGIFFHGGASITCQLLTMVEGLCRAAEHRGHAQPSLGLP